MYKIERRGGGGGSKNRSLGRTRNGSFPMERKIKPPGKISEYAPDVIYVLLNSNQIKIRIHLYNFL